MVDATGVNAGSLFKTFGSKKEIYIAALERYAERDSPRANLLRHFDVPLSQTFRALFDEIIDRTETLDTPNGCLVSNHVSELGSIDDEIAEAGIDLVNATQTLIRLRLEFAREKGELGANTDVEALTAHLFCALQGLYVMAASTRNILDMQRARDMALLAIGNPLYREMEGD